ncbi:MAG: MarR family transcriptional regulator [Bacteroidetes bacterium]|nr:MarR family transcriptional regulator [Bacteroidota bacterium]
MNELNNVLFYKIDKAFRSYRHLALNRFRKAKIEITIDQWTILKTLETNPECTQNELAEKVFKDSASVTRMLNLLVKNKYVHREVSLKDRRRTELKISRAGIKTMNKMLPLILENRSIALEGISDDELIKVREVMDRIAQNCEKFTF